MTETYILDNGDLYSRLQDCSKTRKGFSGTTQNKRDKIIVAAHLKAAVHGRRKTKQNRNRKPDI